MPIETFTYHLKAHTISNMLVSKVFVQKEGGGGGGGGGGSYDSYKYVFKSYKYVFKFRLFQVSGPP